MRTPVRGPRFPYRSSPPLPHHRRGEIGPNTFDAVTGAQFPEVFAVETPVGPVDGRNGGALDLDHGEHEMIPNNVIPVRITGSGRDV